MMYFVGCAGIDIEGDPELLKTLFHQHMVLVHDLLRVYSFFQRPDGDGYAMFITGTDKFNVSFLSPLVADINVRRKVATGQMTNMQGAIGIG